jgi:serine/threonine-protein kinase
MSPEQISGKEVTKKSDIYALGLLLYEIFTGKQAFTADTIPGLLEKQRTSQPTNPSEIVTGIDPMVEDLISKCLAKEPEARPASALHVAMALPGGNPLQAALEAGETPTPEMIAAAPSKGALKPIVALLLLLGFIGGFSLLGYWSGNFALSAYVPLDDSSEVLAGKAKTIIKNLGYTGPSADRNYRFEYDKSYLEYAKLQKNPQEAWEKVRRGQPLVYYFQYRQSPKYLTPKRIAEGIEKDDPPLTEPGMINVELDTKGRLVKFIAVPGLKIEKTEEPNKTDWKTLFDQAGLDISEFKEIEATERSLVIADETTVWKGTLIDHPDIPVRIEAAGYQGKPVYFNVIPEWKESKSSAQLKIKEDSQWDLWSIFVTCIILSFLFGSFLLARYNLKNGRVDMRGAVTIALFFFVIFSLNSLLYFYGRTSVPTIGDKFNLFWEQSAQMLLQSFFIFAAYLAIEPFCRRRLSDLFISWNRLMIGDFRNPMIGRDILAGLCLGTGLQIIRFVLQAFKGYAGTHAINETFFDSRILHFNGIADSLRIVPNSFQDTMIFLFVSMFFILLFSFIFKMKWKSILAMTSLFFGGFAILREAMVQDWIGVLGAFFVLLTIFFVIFRFGLVGLFAFSTAESLTGRGYTTFDTSAFYFPATVIILAVLFAIAIYSYYISTAGKPLFGKGFLEEGG